MAPKTQLLQLMGSSLKARGQPQQSRGLLAGTELRPNLPLLLGGTELDKSLIQFPRAQISVASPLIFREMLGMSALFCGDNYTLVPKTTRDTDS